MGRYLCVAVLVLVCIIQLADNYPVRQKISRRTENEAKDLHARIARYAERLNKGSHGKRGHRRRYNSMNANKAGADHLGWDVVRKDETDVNVDEPKKLGIWGEYHQDGAHDWNGQGNKRPHWGQGHGRRPGRRHRKKKRNNRWRANNRNKDKSFEKDWFDNLRELDDGESGMSVTYDDQADWWNDILGNDDDEADWWKKCKNKFDWWGDLWEHDDKESGKSDIDDSQTNWWDDLWNHGDKESEMSDDLKGKTNWWDDILGNDEKDVDWWENDDDEHDWWRDWIETDDKDTDSRGEWWENEDALANLSEEGGKETSLMGDMSDYGEKEADWWDDWFGSWWGPNDDKADTMDDIRDEHWNNYHQTHIKSDDHMGGMFLWGVWSWFLSHLNNICGHISGGSQEHLANGGHNTGDNLNSSPVIKPNNVINDNSIGSSTINKPDNNPSSAYKPYTTNNPYKDVGNVKHVSANEDSLERFNDNDNVDSGVENGVSNENSANENISEDIEYTYSDDREDDSHSIDNVTVESDETEDKDFDETHDIESGDHHNLESDNNEDGYSDDKKHTDTVYSHNSNPGYSKYENSDNSYDIESTEKQEPPPGNIGYGNPAGINPIAVYHGTTDDSSSIDIHNSVSGSAAGNENPIAVIPVSGNHEAKPSYKFW